VIIWSIAESKLFLNIYKYIFSTIGIAFLVQGVSLAFFSRKPTSGQYHLAVFKIESSAEKPASRMIYRYVFGERLVQKNQQMLTDVNKAVDLFVSKSRGVLLTSKKVEFSEESLIGPQGTALAASYTVKIEMQYRSAEDFYTDFNFAQKLGVISGEKVTEFLSEKDENDMLAEVKDRTSQHVQKQLDIYKQKIGLREVDMSFCEALLRPPGFGSGGGASEGLSGGLSSTERSPAEKEKLPSASKFMVPLNRFVVQNRKPDPNLDIHLPLYWPSVIYEEPQTREVCLTKT
jgi:hypothetical protein